MNRLFNTLRKIVEKPTPVKPQQDALPGFESRVEVLCKYAERAAAYEDDLVSHFKQVQTNLDRLETGVDAALAIGKDRDAFEFVRLAARLRPQYDLLNYEIQAFSSVASELILRVNTLMDNIDEARALARDGTLSIAATRQLDQTMTRLTRYFVMLERVATNRRYELPDKLAAKMMQVIDDRQLDLELAQYVLKRRRVLNSENPSHKGET